MYVSPNAPLPPNSSQPISVPDCSKGVENRAWVEAATAQGKARILQTSSPASYVGLGLPIAKQVRDAQIRQATTPGPQGNYAVPASAAATAALRPPVPQVVPLNVSEQEYNGCCGQPIIQPVVQGPVPRISIPQAPVVVDTPQGPLYLKSQGTGHMPKGITRRALKTPSYNSGLGAAWGDKGSMPCGGTWPMGRSASPQISLGGWFLIFAAGFGITYSMATRR